MVEKTVETNLKKACKEFGIAPDCILSSRIDGDAVIIATKGGSKVTWRPGDEVEKLDPIRVDGIIRKKMKPVTGVKKAKK